MANRLTLQIDRLCFKSAKTGRNTSSGQVWYYLGKVTSTENVPDDYYYDEATKAERVKVLKEMEDEMDQGLQ